MNKIKSICPAFAGILIIAILTVTFSAPVFAQTKQAFQPEVKSNFKADFQSLQQRRSLNLMNGKITDNDSFDPSVKSVMPAPGEKSWIRRNWWVIPVGAAIAVGVFYLIKNSDGNGGGIRCRDGSISNAQNRQGACSYHGGIAQ